MSERIKVINPNKSNHGIKINQGTREVNVKPGQTIYLDKEDVEFLDTTSTTFKRGFLKIVAESVQDKDWLSTIELGVEINGISENDIKKNLISESKVFKKYLKGVKERNDLNERRQVFSTAKKLDLVYSKVKEIEEATGFNFDYESDLA